MMAAVAGARGWRHLLAVSILSLLSGGAAAAEAQTAALIRAHVERLAPVAAPDSADAALVQFYRRRDHAPAWSSGSSARSLQNLAQSLSDLTLDGLTPEDYHLGMLRQAPRANVIAAERAAFDLMATGACLLALQHLQRGRVDPETLYPGWNIERRAFDAARIAEALDAAVAGGRTEPLFAQARPQHPVYPALREAMQRLLDAQKAPDTRDARIAAGPTLKIGDSGARVLALQRRLALFGYLEFAEDGAGEFDAAVETAVRRYQAEQYLDADGTVGPRTRAALNVPLAQRIGQLRANLERARWQLPRAQGDFVVVDVAGYKVRYFRDSRLVWSSSVVVGRSTRRTPVLESAINRIVINPTWTIPPTILREDVLPAVRSDSGYLEQNHIRVFDHSGAELEPREVDWSEPGSFHLQQDAGPHNSLGRIAFFFDNPYAIRLHDTPRKDLFAKVQRPFSSGCVRVARPIELAGILLAGEKGWNGPAIRQAIASGITREVVLSRPVRVLVLYWTVDLREGGGVAFKPDIYGLDRALLQALDDQPAGRAPPVSPARAPR